jgi:release factor glutamine methyltransferase
MKQELIRFLSGPMRKGVAWYLSKPRTYSYQDVTITIKPGVFHPGLFFSTKYILCFLQDQDLSDKTFLELGCGSGLISIVAAKQGAHVTSLDISKNALDNTIMNAQLNKVRLHAVHSDLFNNAPPQKFQWIVINPPYYPHPFNHENSYAWNCGENHEYFERLFESLRAYINRQSKVLMVLSDVCDLQTIFSIAEKNKFSLEKISEKRVWSDGKNYLFWIKDQS